MRLWDRAGKFSLSLSMSTIKNLIFSKKVDWDAIFKEMIIVNDLSTNGWVCNIRLSLVKFLFDE